MHNVEHRIDGDDLIITVKLDKNSADEAPPSSTGRTMLLATANGVPIPSKHCRDLKFSINVTFKK